MSLPGVVSREEWLAARRQLLVREKELTRQRDALNADRRRLPMVRIGEDYVFEGPAGQASLLDLFEGSSQLIIQHVMFDPAWEQACPGCTAGLDELSAGLLAHLKARDTTFAGVSRAPYPKIAAYRAAHGWTFPWYSAYGSDFNYDFHVTLDGAVAPVEYNYRSQAELATADPEWLSEGSTEMPGFSCFLRDGEAVFHTYSTYARGTEGPGGGAYSMLDLTALPPGRLGRAQRPRRQGRPRRPQLLLTVGLGAFGGPAEFAAAAPGGVVADGDVRQSGRGRGHHRDRFIPGPGRAAAAGGGRGCARPGRPGQPGCGLPPGTAHPDPHFRSPPPRR